MADRKQMELSKIDALYSWLSYDLQKMKGELLNEMKYSAVQVGSLYQEIKSDREKSSQAISQEIRYSYKQNQTIYDGLAVMLTKEVGERLGAMEEKVSSLEEIQNTVNEVLAKLQEMEGVDIAALVKENVSDAVKENVSDSLLPRIEEIINEIKYGYTQSQAIYEGLNTLITGELVNKLEEVDVKLALLEQIETTLAELNEKIVDGVVEAVAEKTEESVAAHTGKVLEAVAAIPVAENVDYSRIADEVGDKVIELMGEILVPETAPVKPVEVKIDYDKVVYGTAEKVVESLPYPEKVNYRRIEDGFMKAVQSVQAVVAEETVAAVVNAAVNAAVETALEKVSAMFDIEALAATVASKVVVPVPEVDYDHLANLVAEKLELPAPEVDYDRLADLVAEKLAATTDQVYDVVLDETGINQIAEKVSERLGEVENVNYERIADIVEEKMAGEPCEEPTYELVIDDDGIQAIAKSVSEELCAICSTCEEVVEEETVASEEQLTVEEVVEEPVEEVVEEVTEEPVAEVVEETVEETPVEETVEETPVEETVEEVAEEVTEEPVAEVVEETAVSEELAVTAEHVYEEVGNDLVDAETGLVIRLKKSFTAKLCQSDDKVKGYYSDLKNELTSFKRINSNVSWHGDRFNFGRDTVAKVNICGKTLCFYLALDPENPEFKSTIYHQKNVGNQKAYENTPFMVKVKSDAAAKKALRLVGYLAEKLGTEKEDNFQAVDYVEEYAYASTKELFDNGFIKVTKEKKVELDF